MVLGPFPLFCIFFLSFLVQAEYRDSRGGVFGLDLRFGGRGQFIFLNRVGEEEGVSSDCFFQCSGVAHFGAPR